MELYFQMGHGMISMCKDLISDWGGGTIILSPVNIKQEKLVMHSTNFVRKNAKVLFDPQLFFTRGANSNLKEYTYWPSESTTLTNTSTMLQICKEILKINKDIGSEEIILPSKQLNEDDFHNIYNQSVESVQFFRSKTKKPIFATLALNSDVIRNPDLIENIVNLYNKLDVDGYYVIPEPPNGEYIVKDPKWSISVLKLLVSLKFTKRKVIVGYSNHQGLVYSLANVDAIASGNFMNTRAFSPDKFKLKEKEMKQKSKWFYSPNAMCEIRATLLDVAEQRGRLDLLKPTGLFENKYSSMLFTGAKPSSANFTEGDSFKHYLHCLRVQCNDLKASTYEDAYSKYEFILNSADQRLNEIKAIGITSQSRDFEDGIVANRVAMIACREDYGFKLKMEWS